jgi:hypothetical protein
MLGYADSMIAMKLELIDFPFSQTTQMQNLHRNIMFIMEEWTSTDPDGSMAVIGSCLKLCTYIKPAPKWLPNVCDRSPRSLQCYPEVFASTQTPNKTGSTATSTTFSLTSVVGQSVSRSARHRIICHLLPADAAIRRPMKMSFSKSPFTSVYLYTCVVAADCCTSSFG